MDIYYLKRRANNGNWLQVAPSYSVQTLIDMVHLLPAGNYRIADQAGNILWTNEKNALPKEGAQQNNGQ